MRIPTIVLATALSAPLLHPASATPFTGSTLPAPANPSIGPIQTPFAQPPLPTLPPQFDRRFLAASSNTNRLDYAQAHGAGLVPNLATFDAMDRQHRGFITLEDAFRYERHLRELVWERQHTGPFPF